MQSSGNYIQYPVTNHNGKGKKKKKEIELAILFWDRRPGSAQPRLVTGWKVANLSSLWTLLLTHCVTLVDASPLWASVSLSVP